MSEDYCIYVWAILKGLRIHLVLLLHLCSSEETEYWCGGCVAPLALALPSEDVRRHLTRAKGRDDVFNVRRAYEKTVTLPIEPQVWKPIQ